MTDGQIAAFDFPVGYKLKDGCELQIMIYAT